MQRRDDFIPKTDKGERSLRYTVERHRALRLRRLTRVERRRRVDSFDILAEGLKPVTRRS